VSNPKDDKITADSIEELKQSEDNLTKDNKQIVYIQPDIALQIPIDIPPILKTGHLEDINEVIFYLKK
jgi:hypothetical protein